MLDTSYLFENGMYKKAEACPEVYTKKGESREICGREVKRAGIWDPARSLESCGIMISKDHPVLVETKFNGHRGIYEFSDGKGCFFSKKEGCHHELLPKETSDLLTAYLAKKKVKEAILDGEMFLERCMIDGKETIPNIGKQHEAVAGDHPEMLGNCTFAFKLFDIIRLDGRDVSDLPLAGRKKVLKKLIPSPIEANINGKSVMGKNVSIDPVMGSEMTSIDEVAKYTCAVTARGEEGVVMKDLDGTYDWRGAKKENRSGWWKLKEMLDIDAEVVKACLGENKKTAQHALRYRNLHLGVCENDDCTKLAPLTDKGASLTITGGDFSGDKKFDKNIHYPIVDMIKSKKAKPVGDAWVHVDDAMAQPEHKYSQDEYEFMAGEIKDPATGQIGLPKCVKIPLHAMIVSVVGTEVNPPSGKNKYPVLQGPPKLNIMRADKTRPNDLSYVRNFIT